MDDCGRLQSIFNYPYILYYCYYSSLNSTNKQSKYSQTYQDNTSFLNPGSGVDLSPILEDVTYTISPLIHVPIPLHNCSNKTTIKSRYKQSVIIGSDSLTVEYIGDVLPTGIYPRRLFSYLCKQIIRTRSKTPIIAIPRSRAQFYKEALGINYVPSSKDLDAISQQLKAFIKCQLSLSYSNPNDKSRKQRDSINFVNGDHAWLYDDNLNWQQQIILSDDFFDLIKLTAVPISARALEEFSNSRKLDILNYLLYQNYNLFIKKINYSFQIELLYELFGSGIPTLNEFRRVFNRILTEIKEVIPLDITATDKYSYLLIPSEAALLKQHKRRKTNEIKDQLIVINEDYKDKLKQNYSEIDVEAACIYVSKRSQSGEIRHPYAYLRDVLKNPSWYQRERVNFISNIHKLQYQEYQNLPEEQRKINARFFKDLISKTHIYSVPVEIQPMVEQLKYPERFIVKGIPNFDYCCYIVWAYLHRKVTEFTSISTEKKLVNLLQVICK